MSVGSLGPGHTRPQRPWREVWAVLSTVRSHRNVESRNGNALRFIRSPLACGEGTEAEKPKRNNERELLAPWTRLVVG